MWFNELIDSAREALHPRPVTVKVDGRHYNVGQGEHGPVVAELIEPPYRPSPTLLLNTLTGFVDAYNAKVDNFTLQPHAVHVIDHQTVALVALNADEQGKRQVGVAATNKEANCFQFGVYQTPEQFLLSLQNGFLPTDEVVRLQLLASSLSNESSIGVQDDGYTQVVTVKQGAVSRGEAKLPKRIPLLPYRTFREIDPVQSEFIVRLKGKQGELPTIALIEVDAGRWKHDTAQLVKSWLAKRLPEDTVIIA